MSANIMKSTKLSHSGLPKMKRKNFGGSFGGTFFQVYLCHITDDDGKWTTNIEGAWKKVEWAGVCQSAISSA